MRNLECGIGPLRGRVRAARGVYFSGRVGILPAGPGVSPGRTFLPAAREFGMRNGERLCGREFFRSATFTLHREAFAGDRNGPGPVKQNTARELRMGANDPEWGQESLCSPWFPPVGPLRFFLLIRGHSRDSRAKSSFRFRDRWAIRLFIEIQRFSYPSAATPSGTAD